MSPEEEIKQIRDELFHIRMRMTMFKGKDEYTEIYEQSQRDLQEAKKKLAKLKVKLYREKEGNQRW